MSFLAAHPPMAVAPWMRRAESTTSAASGSSTLFSTSSTRMDSRPTSAGSSATLPAQEAQGAWAADHPELRAASRHGLGRRSSGGRSPAGRQPGLVAHVHTSPSPAPRSLSSQPTVTFNTPRPLYSNVTRSIPSSHPQHHTTSAPSGPPGYISFPPLPAPSPAPVSRAAAPPPYTVQYQQHQGAAAFDHAGRYVSEQQRWTALKANQPLPRPEGHARTPSGAKSPVAGYFPLSVAAGVRLPRSGEPSPARGAREVPPRMMSGESAEWQGQEVSNSPVEAFGMASGGSMALSANAPAFDLSPVNKLSTSTKLTAPTINSHASPSPGIGFIPEPKTSATDLTYAQVQSAKASFLASLATTLSAQRRFTLADHLADIASARASNQVTTKFHLATFEDEWRLRRVRYEAQAGTVIAVAETLGEVGLGRREVEEVIAEWLRG